MSQLPGDNRRVSEPKAKRVFVVADVPATSLREDVRSLADRLDLLGWVRLMDDGTLCVHAEGDEPRLDELISSLRSTPGAGRVEEGPARVEGHEQFAIRGVAAGMFVVQEHQATAHHFDFRLEVEGVLRSWAVPRGPSMDPRAKRLAVQVDDHARERGEFEGRTDGGAVIIWDRGPYEQGGRVRWPEALERGHAVFVLNGDKLHGGFALQRTRGGAKPQWLLIKRRDEHARPGSDIVAERPDSVASGATLRSL
jgi:DNA ligase D-like protein (predicted 3'-phosphoesterase)